MPTPLREKQSSYSAHSMYGIFFVWHISVIGHVYSSASSNTTSRGCILNLWEQAGKCHGKKINISNSMQHMDERYSAWWDAQFLNLIQMSVYYSTTSPCEHSGFGWRLFPVQTLFLQHFLLSFLPVITPITGSHSLQGLHCLPFHFVCTNSVPWSSLWLKAKSRSSSSSIHNLKEYEIQMGENLPVSPFEQR